MTLKSSFAPWQGVPPKRGVVVTSMCSYWKLLNIFLLEAALVGCVVGFPSNTTNTSSQTFSPTADYTSTASSSHSFLSSSFAASSPIPILRSDGVCDK